MILITGQNIKRKKLIKINKSRFLARMSTAFVHIGLGNL